MLKGRARACILSRWSLTDSIRIQTRSRLIGHSPSGRNPQGARGLLPPCAVAVLDFSSAQCLLMWSHPIRKIRNFMCDPERRLRFFFAFRPQCFVALSVFWAVSSHRWAGEVWAKSPHLLSLWSFLGRGRALLARCGVGGDVSYRPVGVSRGSRVFVFFFRRARFLFCATCPYFHRPLFLC